MNTVLLEFAANDGPPPATAEFARVPALGEWLWIAGADSGWWQVFRVLWYSDATTKLIVTRVEFGAATT